MYVSKRSWAINPQWLKSWWETESCTRCKIHPLQRRRHAGIFGRTGTFTFLFCEHHVRCWGGTHLMHFSTNWACRSQSSVGNEKKTAADDSNGVGKALRGQKKSRAQRQRSCEVRSELCAYFKVKVRYLKLKIVMKKKEPLEEGLSLGANDHRCRIHTSKTGTQWEWTQLPPG